VERAVYGSFVERLATAFAKLRAGAPEGDPDCGPIISSKQRTRVLSFVDRARADGIPVLATGQIEKNVSEGGFYVQPTLFCPVPRDHELAREEVFGPVLSILPFDGEDDAVALANDTDYGLVAAVWTSNGARQLRMAKRIRAGQVFISCYGAGAGIELPFGGSGKSGHGREKGFSALREFSKSKTLVFQHG
jgi:aldehyde dehydrogenase (NAD+)